MAKFCSNCGIGVNEDMNFCPECGNMLNGTVTSRTSQMREDSLWGSDLTPEQRKSFQILGFLFLAIFFVILAGI